MLDAGDELGLGLLGGSVGLAVKSRLTDYDVIGYDVKPELVGAALKSKAIDIAEKSSAAAVEGADLVILASPVCTIPEVLKEIAPHLSANAVVSDVGSTKRSIIEAARRLLKYPARFVGSHPMVGGEQSGIAAARAELFEGGDCIVVDDPDVAPDAKQVVTQFWQSLGMRVHVTSARVHDGTVAASSHLPHALAVALFNMMSPAELSLSGKGLADTTRLAAGSADVWRDIFLDNADNLRLSLGRFREELDRLEMLLAPEQADALHRYLADVAQRRRSL